MNKLIPVISLWQPWASLVFVGIKRHETRGRRPPEKYIGRRIGIHATAKFPPLKMMSEELHELCMDQWGCSYNHTLPLGMILGTAFLSAAIPTDVGNPHDDDDRTCGDWSRGRFAWPLSDVQEFDVFLPAKGKQGWWSHDLGADGQSEER